MNAYQFTGQGRTEVSELAVSLKAGSLSHGRAKTFVVQTQERDVPIPTQGHLRHSIIRLSDCKVFHWDVSPGRVDDLCAEMNRRPA